MAKFRAHNWGSWFTFGVCALIAAGGAFIAATSDGMQGLVVGIAAVLAGAYIAWNYHDAKRATASEWTYYNPEWDFNVFCCDPMARARWNFGVARGIVDMVRMVSKTFDENGYAPSEAFFEGLTIRIFTSRFTQGGKVVPFGQEDKFKNVVNGDYNPLTHTLRLSWLPDDPVPAVLPHELAHVPIALKDGLDGNDASHARMKELGLPW